MFQHILKLIWKKKKSNFLMMLEIFVSFLILFAVWSLSVYTYRNYATPTGLSVDRVWTVYLNFNTENDTLRQQYRDLVSRYLKGVPEVEHFSFTSSNMPFSFSSSNRQFSYEGKTVLSEVMFVGDDYPAVMGMSFGPGRWFQPNDTIGGFVPIVITQCLATSLFGTEDPVGKTIKDEESTKKVVGVAPYFRHKSSYQSIENCSFQPVSKWDSDLLLKVSASATADFEARLARSIEQLGKDWTVEVQHMDDMRDTQDNTIEIPILILFVICAFLVFNVGLGMFGVLFQNISRRKGEIGLRRAIGATERQIQSYFIGETVVIAGFGLALGVFFAIQLPLLRVFDVEAGVYLWGIALALVSVLLISMLCAFYPSRQAARIYPAEALHEE
ncbi:MAG: ABC transporter permease [Saprospiraceae bacterium]|nr:ABC transporter permease [Saprospiraceae bacterium]